MRSEPADLSALIEQMAKQLTVLRANLRLLLFHVDYTGSSSFARTTLEHALPRDLIEQVKASIDSP